MEQSRLEQIAAWLEEQGEPRYRIDQVRHAWYRSSSWDDVTALSKDLRAQLAEQFPWMSLKAGVILTSKQDSTKKCLLELSDGNKIESVFMPNARGTRTVCISSQVGCAMACTFCATGKMGLTRNLTLDEIVDQIRFWRFTEPNDPVTNIVYMGMGEPLANYDAVKESARIFTEEMEIGQTRITVSTVGIRAGLNRLLTDEEFPPIRVAISIHAGTDEKRGELVPTHKQTSMKQIAEWTEEYLDRHGNRRHHITLEYVMLQDNNDTEEEARALAKRFKHLSGRIKLNLIPWNPTGGELERSSQERLDAFQAITTAAGLPTTIRYSKGLDIDAACGQLALKT